MIKTLQTIFPNNEIKLQRSRNILYISVTFGTKEQKKANKIKQKIIQKLNCDETGHRLVHSKKNQGIIYLLLDASIINEDLLSQKSIELKQYVAELFDKTTETSFPHSSNPNSQQKKSIQNNPGELPEKNLENNKDNYDHTQQKTTEIKITSTTNKTQNIKKQEQPKLPNKTNNNEKLPKQPDFKHPVNNSSLDNKPDKISPWEIVGGIGIAVGLLAVVGFFAYRIIRGSSSSNNLKQITLKNA